MPILPGSGANPSKLYLGTTEVQKLYAGSVEVWAPAEEAVTSAVEVGWDPDYLAPTAADIVLTTSDSIQDAVNAAIAAGTPQTIRLRGGTYRQAVSIPNAPAYLTIGRYGNERVKITGADVLSGWTLDSGSVYKVTFPISNLEHGSITDLNIFENSAQRYIATDRALTGDLFFQNDDKTFHEDVTYTYGVSPETITAITSETIFGQYSQAQLEQEGVYLQVYCSSNRVQRATITSYNPATFTAQVVGEFPSSFVKATNLEEKIAVMNVRASMTEGTWATEDNGDGTCTAYVWPVNPANLTSNIEYSVRKAGVRIAGNVTTGILIEGLEVVQQANADVTGDAGISTSNLLAADRNNITIRHCRVGDTMFVDYGSMSLAYIDGLVIERVTQENVITYAMSIRGVNNVRVSGTYADHIGASACAGYGCTDMVWSFSEYHRVGQAAHPNQANFYEGCDAVTIHAVKGFRSTGYFTPQEASRFNMLFCSIPVNETVGDSRAIAYQQRSVGAGQGGPDGSGAPIADSHFMVINCETPPDTVDETYAGLSLNITGGSAETLSVLNNIAYGGGSSRAYNGSPAIPLNQIDYRGNIYTALGYFQSATYGWALGAGEAVTTADDAYADYVLGDFRHRGSSLARGATGVSILSQIQILEALHPDHNFRRDINGATIDPSAPPVGPALDLGAVPVTIPGTMTAPTFSAATSSSITIARASAPSSNGSAISRYDVRYRADGGVWVEVTNTGTTTEVTGLTAGQLIEAETRAVNGIGVGRWGATGSSYTSNYAPGQWAAPAVNTNSAVVRSEGSPHFAATATQATIAFLAEMPASIPADATMCAVESRGSINLKASNGGLRIRMTDTGGNALFDVTTAGFTPAAAPSPMVLTVIQMDVRSGFERVAYFRSTDTPTVFTPAANPTSAPMVFDRDVTRGFTFFGSATATSLLTIPRFSYAWVETGYIRPYSDFVDGDGFPIDPSTIAEGPQGAGNRLLIQSPLSTLSAQIDGDANLSWVNASRPTDV